ncbi:MoaA/NifB/PqqE/SkfB family radical SAM enzyme [Anaerobacterium chartisolvens]|uniref:MoaA/NifB/PqqE/SkfB family radical SAM enzyme n=1 Tax=Anaerobacterium chartisolvens TaxID=1297424 RepID=A0A369BA45_9FIRM|nr:radical SAM protein [Anaerobacterium chartisolvens]RCX17468.1 MoaA/NifB/PqqE/SkfB family radical SAM enzyme [Anaerobacterium chartisolvens]
MAYKNSFSKNLDSLKKFLSGRAPGQVVIQYTDACNAKCPQCGMNIHADFKRSRLNKDCIKRSIDAAVQNGVKSVSFTGGEPLIYFDDVLELIRYAAEAGIDLIRTGTNGFLFMNPESEEFEPKIAKIAEAFSKTKLRNFWISIDSCVPEVHEQMRGLPGVIRGIEKALPIFHRHGIYPSANLGINRNMGGKDTRSVKLHPQYPEIFYETYKQTFENFLKLITGLGFTIVNMCYPMSLAENSSDCGMEAVYGAASTDSVVNFLPKEKEYIFKALWNMIPVYRPRIRTFMPRCSVRSLIRHYSGQNDYSYSCRGGIDFFFMDARNGDVYPCGYRGNDNLGKLWDIDLKSINRKAYCRLCDWECFRDPSELLGPAIDLAVRPVSILKRFLSDKEYAGTWLSDIRYYMDCDFFDGRFAPDYNKLSRWNKQSAGCI